jgi:hypothetical protein
MKTDLIMFMKNNSIKKIMIKKESRNDSTHLLKDIKSTILIK